MKKRIESGASLLEVITVICIMGILSYSAFALYAKAMNSIRVNYVIQQVFIKAAELDSEAFYSKRKGKLVDLKVIDSDGKLSYNYKIENFARSEEDIKVTIAGVFTEGMCSALIEKITTQEYAGLKKILVKYTEHRADDTQGTKSLDSQCPEKEEGVEKIEITSMTFVIDSGFQRR